MIWTIPVQKGCCKQISRSASFFSAKEMVGFPVNTATVDEMFSEIQYNCAYYSVMNQKVFASSNIFKWKTNRRWHAPVFVNVFTWLVIKSKMKKIFVRSFVSPFNLQILLLSTRFWQCPTQQLLEIYFPRTIIPWLKQSETGLPTNCVQTAHSCLSILFSDLEDQCAQARKRVSKKSTLALKPRADGTRSPKQGYQWPNEKDLCPPKI